MEARGHLAPSRPDFKPPLFHNSIKAGGSEKPPHTAFLGSLCPPHGRSFGVALKLPCRVQRSAAQEAYFASQVAFRHIRKVPHEEAVKGGPEQTEAKASLHFDLLAPVPADLVPFAGLLESLDDCAWRFLSTQEPLEKDSEILPVPAPGPV